jgi:release factor glutamine methyltransferase
VTIRTNVGSLLAQGVHGLGAAGADTPAALEAAVLLAHVLGTTRSQLIADAEAAVNAAAARRYATLIKRRALGEPVAYLTGRREFWSLELTVSPAVLVPRPETELLVERALALQASDRARVVDLGTGSGAVALALACERPNWRVTATDVSSEALAVARANAARLGLAVQFLQGSWFAPLNCARFDLVVSNPPYVAAGDPALASAALAHEPRLALTPGDDALACLRLIVRAAGQHLRPGGWLLLEHGADQGAAVRHELVLAGYRYVRSHRDLASHERATEGQYGQI